MASREPIELPLRGSWLIGFSAFEPDGGALDCTGAEVELVIGEIGGADLYSNNAPNWTDRLTGVGYWQIDPDDLDREDAGLAARTYRYWWLVTMPDGTVYEEAAADVTFTL